MNHQRFTINRLLRLCPALLLCTTAAASNFQQADKTPIIPPAILQTQVNVQTNSQANLSVKGEGVAAHYGTVDARQSVAGSAPMNVHLAGGSPQYERRREPHEYYVQGETFIHRVPPNWQEAFEVFLYAANANPPHPGACIRCAEYCERKIPSDIENALRYYNIALSTAEKPQGAYRGLMNLHHRVGVSSTRPHTKKVNFQKAQEYGAQITIPILTDDDILNDIDHQLSQLGVSVTAVPVPVADLLNCATPMVRASMVSPSWIDPLPIPPSSQMSLNTPLDQPESHTTITQLIDELVLSANQGIKASRDQLIQLAERGHCDAALAMVALYEEGRSIKRDDRQIFYFTMKAAETGHPSSQYETGVYYHTGFGTTIDLDEAARWYRFAADLDDVNAIEALAGCYKAGWGIQQDVTEAVRLYTIAANREHPKAIMELVECYLAEAGGLSKNSADAAYYCNLVVGQGHARAQYQMGIMNEEGLGGLTQNDEAAIQWYRLSAQGDYHLGLFKLVDCYMSQKGGLNNKCAEAVGFYKRAGEKRYGPVVSILVDCYLKQIAGLKKDTVEAVRIYQMGADMLYTPAIRALVDSHIRKIGGLQKHDEDAVKWYQVAAEMGYDPAIMALVDCYINETDTLKKYSKEAIKWYCIAVDKGYNPGIRVIPTMASGHEKSYFRFINGKLIFDNKMGQRREFDIRQFAPTLEGEFYLMGLTFEDQRDNNKIKSVSDYLRIKVGVRKAQENDSKVTCWLTPKFIGLGGHPWDNRRGGYETAVDAPFGIMWTYGNYDMRCFLHWRGGSFDFPPTTLVADRHGYGKWGERQDEQIGHRTHRALDELCSYYPALSTFSLNFS